MNRLLSIALSALAATAACSSLPAQTFYYVGPAGGDFFDEANWNDSADGAGGAPVGDLIPDSASGAIAIDLIIDGGMAEAAGQVDFGAGSLSLLGGASLSITGAGNVLDMNPDSAFNLVDSTLSVAGDMFFEGAASFSGGSVTSEGDDIEFQDALTSLAINGTSFATPADNIIFDAQLGAITGASFFSVDRLGLRNTTADPTSRLVMADSSIDINGGAGDVDDVFDTNNGNGAILALDGASTLLANQIDDGISLELLGSSVATLTTTSGAVDAANGGTITIFSTSARLVLTNESDTDVRGALVNGLTGLSYLDDPSAWNVSNWNGSDAATLSLVPEPGAVAALACLTLLTAVRRTRS